MSVKNRFGFMLGSSWKLKVVSSCWKYNLTFIVHYAGLFIEVVLNICILCMSMSKFAITMKSYKSHWKGLILAHNVDFDIFIHAFTFREGKPFSGNIPQAHKVIHKNGLKQLYIS